ncbi:hypothetical protein AACH06_01925 [Ideonella sp. DXS29W]|uniref:Uncharacterized protein n=1 Tax=Ideonella lacteola TaxID=2984193 RepID=A0ABU9BIM0_9BURK
MWPHRPIGRMLITLAIALLGGLALLLDAAAPPGDGHLVAWHAVSMLTLAGLAAWALWSPQLPRSTGQLLAGVLGGLLAGGAALAAQRLPANGASSSMASVMTAVLLMAATLFAIGTRWARREIRW